MGIYRGAGGTGDAVADSSSEALLVRNLAIEVQADADAAAASAAAALVSENNAADSETAAASLATAAASSASTASTQATNASNSASAASTSATNAATSATAAQTAETNAETAETNAASSASLAQNWAIKVSGPVSGSDYSSKYNANLSAASASVAAASESSASTSATNASNSASAAATSATNASNSATAAAGSATSASSSASSASTSASNAATSETNAASSATTATTQAGIATTQATNAASSASAASTSATNASNSASTAATQATNAATSATNASNSASSAATSATNAAASYDSFDDRYLGPKSVAPTLDNDGNTLLTGALYFNIVDNAMKVWSGSAWLDAYASLSGALIAANNLSDLANKATARTNLGVEIGTNVQAWDADLDTWATKTAPTGTVVGTSDTQTLTNKTLTTPTIDKINTSVSGVSLGAGNASIMKNRIINGAMVIDQRNAGASVTPIDSQYTIDRWRASVTQTSKITIQQNAGAVTPPAGFTNYLGVTSTSAYSVGAGDIFGFLQFIEGYNIADLGFGTVNAKPVTLSFWVRSSLTGTFSGALYNGVPDYSYPFTYTISTANTWTQISVTVAGPTAGTWSTNNTAGLGVYFCLGTGSTYGGTAGSWTSGLKLGVSSAVSVVGTSGATFYITGVQLEVGSSATGFEYRQYGQELALCQRYYTKITSFATSGQLAFGMSVSTNAAWVQLTAAPVALRASPTINYSGIVVTDNVNYSSNVTSIAGSAQTLTGGGVAFVSGAVATIYRPAYVNTSSSAGYIDYSAEL